MKALRRQWLSAALLAGLLVMGAAGALFVYLADEVGEQAWLTRFDSTVAEFFHHHGAPWLVHAFEAVTFLGSASTLTVLGLAVALVLAALRRWSLLLGVGGGARRHRPPKHNVKTGRSALASPPARTVGHRARLEFSERPRDGFVGCVRLFGLPAHPHNPGQLPAPDDCHGACSPRVAHRVQPNLLGRSLPERRDRRLRGGGRLAHVLHPHDPPGARPVELVPHPAWREAHAGMTSPTRQAHRIGVRLPR